MRKLLRFHMGILSYHILYFILRITGFRHKISIIGGI